MRYVTLEACSDEYDTSLGFKIEGTPSFDGFSADRDGLMIAHDLIEHQNGLSNMGPVWDEIEALGGVWHCRGRWGDLGTSNYYSPEENLASDLVNMFSDWDGWNGPHSMATLPHDQDEAFRYIIQKAREDIPEEYDRETFCEFYLNGRMDEYLNLALHRMRTGYRKCNRRFGDQFRSNNQLGAIKIEVEKSVKWIDFEGQRFRLAWGAGQASIDEIYDEGGYY